MKHAESYWAATAAFGEPRSPLASDVQCDVVIVGGGFTGLSAAYHLQSMGVSTVVLEQNRVGWGASGRNGGHLLVGFKHGFSWIAEHWGIEAARAMLKMSLSAVDLVKGTVQEHQIRCSLSESGNLWAAHKPNHLEGFKHEQEFLEKHFDYQTWTLDEKQMHEELGSSAYHGVHVDPHGASFHPLNYALGLAGVVEERGGRIYERSGAREIQPLKEGVRIIAGNGQVTASQLIVAANGYTDTLFPKLHKSIVATNSDIIVTEPLDEELAQRLVPKGRVTSDSKRLLYYFRLTPDRRFLFGGRGDSKKLRAGMLWVFPELTDYRVEYEWSGLVGITLDMFPHIGQTSEGYHFALGYCGRGAAVANLMGKLLALNIVGKEREAYPLENVPVRQIPLHSLRGLGDKFMGAYYSVLDRFA